jgi:hypothetical protein
MERRNETSKGARARKKRRKRERMKEGKLKLIPLKQNNSCSDQI